MPLPSSGTYWTALSEDEKRPIRERALRMKNAGLNNVEISRELQIPYNRVKDELVNAMREFCDEPVQFKAAAQLSMLRDLQRAFYQQAMRGDERAADKLLRVMDHEAKLVGLYAPVRVQPILGGGVSDAEFAVVAEAFLQRAGRPVPAHIASAAASARAAGVLGPGTVVDEEAAS